MYIQYAKDFYSGRILGVVVAIATNKIGFALAKPNGIIDKEVKKELITIAAARSVLKNADENLKELNLYMARNNKGSKSNTAFYDKVDMIHEMYVDMCYKASHSMSLPTMVENKGF